MELSFPLECHLVVKTSTVTGERLAWKGCLSFILPRTIHLLQNSLEISIGLRPPSLSGAVLGLEIQATLGLQMNVNWRAGAKKGHGGYDGNLPRSLVLFISLSTVYTIIDKVPFSSPFSS